MILWLLFFAILAWTVHFRYKRRNRYKLAASIKSTKDNLPFIGIVHKLIGNTEDIMKSLQSISYEVIRNNGILKGWVAHMLFFFVTDPKDIEIILKTCMEKDDLNRFARRLTGNGTVFAPVSIWRKRRKLLVPAFSPKIVEQFVEIFSEQSEILTEKLLQNVEKEKLSIWPYVSSYTLDTTTESTMGVKINAQGNPNSVFLTSISRVLHLICERIAHLWLQPDWMFKLFPQFKEHEECLKQLKNFTDTVVQKKREDVITERSIKEEVDNELASGQTLPAGSGIVISIWGAHRDPKYWGPDAEHFDPDRFCPERYNLKYPCSYVPFSSGPRNCVGYQYALMSVKTSLASILRRFRVVGKPEKSPIPRIRVKIDMMLKAVDEFEVTLERRNCCE